MEHADFVIGGEFTVEGNGAKWGRWRVTDVGSRTVLAIGIDQAVDLPADSCGNAPYVPYLQAVKDGYFSGPPYRVDEVPFDERDFANCRKG